MAIQRSALAYLPEQKRDFIRAFQQPAAYPVGVQHPTQSARSVPVVATWRWDPAIRGQKAFIRTVGGTHTEYWAHVDFDRGYRDGFLSFLESEKGVTRASVPSTLHADHLLNKAFALRHGLGYVRMALVEGEFNMDYGRKIEKNLTQSQARDNSQYLFDYIVLMKALHIKPPTDPDDYRTRREDIASYLEAAGAEKRELALQGMDGIFKLWDVL